MPSTNPRPLARLVLALAASCCLAVSAGCSTLPPTIAPRLPPPADLAQLCEPGPAYPEADATLDEWRQILQARELAAADCRRRHGGLVEAWPSAVPTPQR